MPDELVPCGWRAGVGSYSHADNESYIPPPPYPGPPVPVAPHMVAMPPVMAPPPGGLGGPLVQSWSTAQYSMACPPLFVIPAPMHVPMPLPPPPPSMGSGPSLPMTVPAPQPPSQTNSKKEKGEGKTPAKKEKGEEKTPVTKKPNVHPGAEYLYPADNVYIKVPSGGEKLWKLAPGKRFDFKVFKVATSTTVKELLGLLGGGDKHALTECFEAGDGRWYKGRTIVHKDGGVKMQEVGWKPRRDETDPIWLCLHTTKDK